MMEVTNIYWRVTCDDPFKDSHIPVWGISDQKGNVIAKGMVQLPAEYVVQLHNLRLRLGQLSDQGVEK